VVTWIHNGGPYVVDPAAVDAMVADIFASGPLTDLIT
jgi:hypothetical protein